MKIPPHKVPCCCLAVWAEIFQVRWGTTTRPARRGGHWPDGTLGEGYLEIPNLTWVFKTGNRQSPMRRINFFFSTLCSPPRPPQKTTTTTTSQNLAGSFKIRARSCLLHVVRLETPSALFRSVESCSLTSSITSASIFAIAGASLSAVTRLLLDTCPPYRASASIGSFSDRPFSRYPSRDPNLSMINPRI